MTTDSLVLHEDSLCRIEKSTNPPGLRLWGSLNGDARSILERELDYALRDGHDLHIDLSRLDFISIGCMSALLDAAVYLRLDGCRLIMLGPNLAVRLTIAICHGTVPDNVEIIPYPT